MSSNNSTEPASSPSSAPSSIPPSTDISSFVSSVESTVSSEVPPTTSITTTPTPTTTTQAPPTTQATTAETTSTTTAPSSAPTTVVRTSIISDSSGAAQSTVVITITSSQSQSTVAPATTTAAAESSAASSAAPAGLQPDGSKSDSGGGLSSGGKTAVAVVVPVVVVALLVLAGIFLWKKRRQRKSAEEARRKEVEDYNFNPNTDPTLPVVAGGPEMAEDSVGYRGWGKTTTTSNRHPSTTLSGGHTQLSDSGSNPGGYHSPGSPANAAYSEGGSGDPLMAGRRTTMDSETVGALGAAPVASANMGGVRRGPSNASSSYSAANHSDHSGEAPIPLSNPQDYYTDNSYYQGGPYGENGYGPGQQPVIQNVQARRNTRIENPSVFPQQGNAGISANF